MSMPSRLRPLMTVRVSAIRADRFACQNIIHGRHPRVGDVGVVLEVYTKPEPAYEVECTDPATSATVWLEPMYPDELEAGPDEPGAPSPGQHWPTPYRGQRNAE